MRKLEHSKTAAEKSKPVEDIVIFEKKTVEQQEGLGTLARKIRLEDSLTVRQTIGEQGDEGHGGHHHAAAGGKNRDT